jgi:hypothetical protein
MAGGSEELSIIVRMRDFATRQFQTLSGTIGRWAQTGIQKVGQFAASFLSFRGIIATFASIWAGMKIVDEIAHIENMDIAFANLTKGVGGASAVMKAMQDATHGATCEVELMEAANRAILLGVGKTAKEFGELAGLARRLGAAVGVGTIEAFDALTNSMARQNARALISIGLVVSAEEANKKYAAALGVDVKELNEVQKKQAFTNAVFETAKKKVRDLGEDTLSLSDRWGQFKESIMDIAQSLMRSAIPTLKIFFADMSKWINASRPIIMNLLADVAEDVAKVADLINPTLQKVGALFLVLQYHWNRGFIPEDVERKTTKSTTAVGRALRELANDIRLSASNSKNDLEDMGRALDLFYGYTTEKKMDISEVPLMDSPEQHRLRMQTVEDLKSEKEIFLGINKAVEQEDRHMAHLIKEWEEKRDVMGSVKNAFVELRAQSEEWGAAMYEGIMATTQAIGSGLADGIIAIGENFRNAGKAVKEMTVSILKDLAKIWLQLVMIKAVQAGMGALSGFFGGGSQILEMPVGMQMPHLQHGGRARRGGAFVVGEAGPEIVSLPRGAMVTPNSAIGGTTVTVNYAPQFANPAAEGDFLRTRRNKETIKSIVAEAMRESVGFREAMS